MNELLWSPPAERVASSNVAAFAARVGKSALVQRRHYAALWQWSVDEPEAFWVALAEFGKVAWERHFRDRSELRS